MLIIQFSNINAFLNESLIVTIHARIKVIKSCKSIFSIFK